MRRRWETHNKKKKKKTAAPPQNTARPPPHGITDLDRVAVGEQEDDLKGVLDDADRHQLLSVVAAVHHQRVGEALHHRALGLAEPLDVEAAGRVRQVPRGLRLDRDYLTRGGRERETRIVSAKVETDDGVIHAATSISRTVVTEGNVRDIEVLEGPLAEELDLSGHLVQPA